MPREAKRLTIRLDPDTHERTRYWAGKRQLSLAAYIELALAEKIARENGDYDLPAAEILRLQQLIAGQHAMATELSLLRQTVMNYSRLMDSLCHGDNIFEDQLSRNEDAVKKQG